jgi:NADH-quinone oxidoreductase subunit G
MSDSSVKLTIDGIEVVVPAGTLIVDAAKKVGIDIPVFCYHPKMEPVGMCRMCLVEVGMPKVDRQTGQAVLNAEGQPVIEFRPKLETSCTTPVSEGMHVLVSSEVARKGREQIVEFILTSHPLDCPICDKGGECPLQNLTMAAGPGKSRFLFEDKKHMDKHVPLGDLIFLDRERCIQCARCVRYQDEVVDEPVLAFKERGRSLEIVTFSNPGFDSYFSGNTTDICPVGALTTADFRFGARPWEMNSAASICTHCAVGCNTVLNTRREARARGREVVKRVMPRQNEWVNEIWICDKGRFAHHYAASEQRLATPMIRKGEKLVKTSWDQALAKAAEGLKVPKSLLGLVGGRATNEDLFTMKQLITALEGTTLLYDHMAGGDLIQQVGVGRGTNLSDLKDGDAIIVFAADLHESAPIWWLRVKNAAKRGVALIVANSRPTRLDPFATHLLSFNLGEAVPTALGLLHGVVGKKELADYKGDASIADVVEVIKGSENLVIFYGQEGLRFQDTHALSEALASVLAASGHVGKANNGLIAVWSKSNTQGAWDMGLQANPVMLREALDAKGAAIVMAADPVGDEPELASSFEGLDFLVVQDLFLSKTAALADVIFPAQSFIEREGSMTSGERRVQRFYPAVQAYADSQPDWRILTRIGKALDLSLEDTSAAGVFLEIGKQIPDYAALSYQALAQVQEQWPPVGAADLYYGGTTYHNQQGLGVQLEPATQRGETFTVRWSEPGRFPTRGKLWLVPVERLYDRGITVQSSELLEPRVAKLQLRLSPDDAKRLGIESGTAVKLQLNGRKIEAPAVVEELVPKGQVIVDRSLGVEAVEPVSVELKPAD